MRQAISSALLRAGYCGGFLAVALLVAACDTGSSTGPSPTGWLPLGTWGGDTAGVTVTATGAHLTVGCTYGDIPGPIPVDMNGHFSVSGTYLLRAFPVAMMPALPAQFAGQVDHGQLTMVVAVNDTIEKRLVVLGPMVMMYGIAPRLRPCPI